MHIGFNCYEYPPCSHGGVGSFTIDLAESLVKNGFKVTVFGYYFDQVLILKNPVDEIINGVRVIRMPQYKRYKIPQLNLIASRIALYRLIKKIHKETPFDLIESPEASGWFAFGLPLDISLISRIHGGQTYFGEELNRKASRLIRFFEKMQLKKSFKIIAVSNYVGSRTLNILHIKKNYKVIYNGIKSDLFKYNSDASFEDGLIVFTGSILIKKGVENLVRAMNIVFENMPDTKLILAGKDTAKLKSGILFRDYLINLIHPQFKQNIIFKGNINRNKELISLLNRAQICCFPSFAEAFGLAPLEAMALGKATIFSKYTSGPEVIEDGVSGFLCDPKDVNDIAKKILLLLGDKTLCIKLGKKGRERFYDNFDYHVILQQNLDFYSNIVRNE